MQVGRVGLGRTGAGTARLAPPRAVWVEVPHGDPTGQKIAALRQQVGGHPVTER
jgi:6-phosphogluconate dehydrogenase (decarboxylating)